MSSTMFAGVFILAVLPCMGQGHKVQISSGQADLNEALSTAQDEEPNPLRAVASLLLGFNALSSGDGLAGFAARTSSRMPSRNTGASMQVDAQVPAPSLSRIEVGSSLQTSQSLPLSYVSSWPIWLGAPDGSSVTRLPDSTTEGGWVNPQAFEQLWLPKDLPAPSCRAALGFVLKDGVVRYMFPTLETTVLTPSGMLWHNRGLNSLPLAKAWIPFGEVQNEELRMSAYMQPLSNESEVEPWTLLAQDMSVDKAYETLFEIIGSAPDELGQGFCFLLIPLADEKAQLPCAEPGTRVRLFLSDDQVTPTSVNPEDHGECDISTFEVAPGGQSEYLPDAYKPLYQEVQRRGLADMLS